LGLLIWQSSHRIQPVALNALDAFVADQQQPISRPEAIRVILMKFFRSKGYLSKTTDVPSERKQGSLSSIKRAFGC
jgi:hypothetical protein